MELLWDMAVLFIACGSIGKGDARSVHEFNVLAKRYDNVSLDCPDTLPGPSVWLIPSDRGLVTYSVGSVINTKYKKEKFISLVKNKIKEKYDLMILNITSSNAGQYKCQGVEDGVLTEYSFHLWILEKPILNTTYEEYKATLGNPVLVSVSTETLQTPIVSWSLSSGGTLGNWTVVKTSRGNYKMRSTIIPIIKMHFGLYSISVSNDAGSSIVTIKLSDKDSPIDVRPTRVYCNSTSQTIVNCTLMTNRLPEWKSYWLHTRKGKFIQRITGFRKDNKSSIIIKFCDYREEGEYTCIWEKASQVYSQNVITVVKGTPVVTKSNIDIYGSCFCLELYTYTYSNKVDVIWFQGHKIVHNSFNYNISLRESIVQLSYWGMDVKEKGYVTTLCVNDSKMSATHVFSCQVTSFNGRIKFKFDKERISQYLYGLRAVQSTLRPDNVDNNITDASTKSNWPSTFEKQAFLYILIPLGLVIVNIGVIAMIINFRSRYENSGVSQYELSMQRTWNNGLSDESLYMEFMDRSLSIEGTDPQADINNGDYEDIDCDSLEETSE